MDTRDQLISLGMHNHDNSQSNDEKNINEKVDDIPYLVCTYSFSILDLHRTFPENIYFATSDGLRKPLRNVLGAVAHKNHDQGYCQVCK